MAGKENGNIIFETKILGNVTFNISELQCTLYNRLFFHFTLNASQKWQNNDGWPENANIII
jgi:hypothetical protein